MILVVIPAVPASRVDDGKYLLDEKAVSGLELYLKYWPGSVRCIFRETVGSASEFSSSYDERALPFEIKTIPIDASVPDELISDAAVVLASGDMVSDFPIVQQGRRLGVPVCFTIEYIHETRMQIMRLNQPSPVRRARSTAWHLLTEIKRRRAFARSSGLQANGTPASEAYQKFSPDIMTYFDTRLSINHMVTEEELTEKQNWVIAGRPIRLAFSGRLEPMKGVDDLIKIAREARDRGLDFSLDIFGAGSLEPTIRSELSSQFLTDTVRIHKPIHFSTQLVPVMREKVDLFLCCHRQSDPSCTYLETLGCGVPILGYDNKAWSGILRLSGAGWSVPMNDNGAVVQELMKINSERGVLANKMRVARDFAIPHSSENEFKGRVEHLKRIAMAFSPSK